MNEEFAATPARPGDPSDFKRDQPDRERLKHQLNAMRELQEVSSVLIGGHDLPKLYDKIVATAATLMSADAASMQLFDEASSKLRLIAWRGFHPASAAHWEWVEAGPGSACGRALAAGERTMLTDAGAEIEEAGDLEAHRLSGSVSVQSTPLRAYTGEVVGMLSTHWRERRIPTEEELNSFDILARMAADLLARLKREEALRSSEAQIEAELRHATLLRDIAARLVTEESLQAIYEEILDVAIEITGAKAGTVQMLDPEKDELVMLASRGLGAQTLEFFARVDAGSGTSCGQAMRTGERSYLDFDPEASEISARLHVQDGVLSAQSTLLSSRSGATIGMVSTHWGEPGHRLTKPQQRFLDLLARQAADIIEQRRADAALRESRARYQALFAASPVPFLVVAPDAPDFTITAVNDAYLAATYATREMLIGRKLLDVFTVDPDDSGRQGSGLVSGSIQKVLTTQQTDVMDRLRYDLVKPDGQIEARWWLSINAPMFDADGNVTAIIHQATNVTEQYYAEEALRESEQRWRLIVENARDYAIFTTDPEGIVTDWHEGAEAVFGYSREEIIGGDGDILFTAEDRAKGEPEKERATARSEGKADDVRWHVCKDGESVFIEGVNTSLRHADGSLAGFLKMGADATERHASEQRQKLLLAELQHRVRNILAMIRSVVTRTASEETSAFDYAQHLAGRLDAMARTQAILTRRPGEGIELEDLVREELVAQSSAQDRFGLQGPAILLSPKAAEVLTLALHELATNSIKYGSLGADGALSITWNIEDRDAEKWLTLMWEEASIDIANPPSRRGFGTELITKRVPYELEGTGTIEFEAEAMRATISFPLKSKGSILETGSATSSDRRP